MIFPLNVTTFNHITLTLYTPEIEKSLYCHVILPVHTGNSIWKGGGYIMQIIIHMRITSKLEGFV